MSRRGTVGWQGLVRRADHAAILVLEEIQHFAGSCTLAEQMDATLAQVCDAGHGFKHLAE
jgi:hypothetical protein